VKLSTSITSTQAMQYEHARARMRARRELVASGDTGGFSDFLHRWYESEDRPHAFLGLSAVMLEAESPDFWRLLAKHWPGFDAVPHAAYAGTFRSRRAAWSADCMELADRALYDQLPPLVSLHRGQSGEAPIGLSWTLSREVAEGFARGHRGKRVLSRVVLATRVRKTSIAFICTDREEEEAVLFRPPRRGASIAQCAVSS
jgi:hypothetical protein